MVTTRIVSAVVAGYFCSLAMAAPTLTIDVPNSVDKRATVSDAAFGYASLNGGTTGGTGGTTTTVSSYAAFTAAVSGDSKKVVYVSGPITKTADQVKVGSNTSIIGKSYTAILTGFGL